MGLLAADRRKRWHFSSPCRKCVPRGAWVFWAEHHKVLCYWTNLCHGVSIWGALLKRSALLFYLFGHSFFFCWPHHFSDMSLGFGDFGEGPSEVRVHHTADVSMEVSQDKTLGVLLYLHSNWILCWVVHLDHQKIKLIRCLNEDDPKEALFTYIRSNS